MDYSLHLVTGLLIVAALATTSANSASVYKNEDYRLPTNTVPVSYELKLIPFMEDGNFTFRGEVTIDVRVIEPTSSITFHKNGPNINEDSVSVISGDVNVKVVNQTYVPELHFYTLTFATALAPGYYSIHIKFSGVLASDMNGFYRSSYETKSGETRWLATTQFGPVYARRAFPCFDEPHLKARFNISIAHWPNQTALSNTAAVFTSDVDSTIGNRVWTHFSTTPVMSTYLIAFVVSDFGHLSSDDGFFSVWSRPEALNSANYAVTFSEKIFRKLSNFVGPTHKPPLTKIHEIAIPDFATGAMENWGLVTYRESFVLYEDGVSTTAYKELAAYVITHELAHQWFGDLVTHSWWKYLWLTEGFGSYFEYMMATVETTWRFEERITVDYYHPAMIDDSTDASHPMNVEVYSESQIEGIYDSITYSKAAGVIRMMAHFLGETIFQAGLQRYLDKNAYSVATPDDLWEALTEVNTESSSPVLQAHVDVKTVMDTWTNQKGYPLVTITRNYSSATQKVSQERFLLKGRGSSEDTTEYRWWIPLNFATETNPDFTSTAPTNWISAQNESITMNGFSATEWIICNIRQTGFYRVNYDDTNWKMIAAYLQTPSYSRIDVLNRAQLVDDALNLARSGYLNYRIALSLTSYLAQETSAAPWMTSLNSFAHLNRILSQSVAHADFQAYLLSLLAPLCETIGFEERETDAHFVKGLRPNTNYWACTMGSTACRKKAEEMLLDYYANPSESNIPANLEDWAYCAGLRSANASVWKFMQEHQPSYLGCSHDVDILNSYLALTLPTNSSNHSQDANTIFSAIYVEGSDNLNLAFNFLLSNYKAISETCGGMECIGEILQGFASRLTSNAQLKKLEELVTSQREALGDTVTVVEGVIEVIKENISWLEKYEKDIIGFLAETVPRA